MARTSLEIPVRGSNEVIEVPLAELPDDWREVHAAIADEGAPCELYHTAAGAYWRRGDARAAEALWAAGVAAGRAARPDRPPAAVAQMQSALAAAAMRRGDLSAAAALLNDAERAGAAPHAEVLLRRAQLLAATGRARQALYPLQTVLRGNAEGATSPAVINAARGLLAAATLLASGGTRSAEGDAQLAAAAEGATRAASEASSPALRGALHAAAGHCRLAAGQDARALDCFSAAASAGDAGGRAAAGLLLVRDTSTLATGLRELKAVYKSWDRRPANASASSAPESGNRVESFTESGNRVESLTESGSHAKSGAESGSGVASDSHSGSRVASDSHSGSRVESKSDFTTDARPLDGMHAVCTALAEHFCIRGDAARALALADAAADAARLSGAAAAAAHDAALPSLRRSLAQMHAVRGRALGCDYDAYSAAVRADATLLCAQAGLARALLARGDARAALVCLEIVSSGLGSAAPGALRAAHGAALLATGGDAARAAALLQGAASSGAYVAPPAVWRLLGDALARASGPRLDAAAMRDAYAHAQPSYADDAVLLSNLAVADAQCRAAGQSAGPSAHAVARARDFLFGVGRDAALANQIDAGVRAVLRFNAARLLELDGGAAEREEAGRAYRALAAELAGQGGVSDGLAACCLCRLAALAGDAGRAAELAKEALAADPACASAWLLLGDAQAAMAAYAPARRAYERVLRDVDRRDRRALVSLGGVCLAEASRRHGGREYLRRALELFAKALASAPGDVAAAAGVAAVLGASGRSADAKDAYLLLRGPLSAPGLAGSALARAASAGLGHAFADLGQADAALAAYRQAGDPVLAARALYMRGVSEAGDVSLLEAADCLESLLLGGDSDASTDAADVRLNAALCLLEAARRAPGLARREQLLSRAERHISECAASKRASHLSAQVASLRKSAPPVGSSDTGDSAAERDVRLEALLAERAAAAAAAQAAAHAAAEAAAAEEARAAALAAELAETLRAARERQAATLGGGRRAGRKRAASTDESSGSGSESGDSGQSGEEAPEARARRTAGAKRTRARRTSAADDGAIEGEAPSGSAGQAGDAGETDAQPGVSTRGAKTKSGDRSQRAAGATRGTGRRGKRAAAVSIQEEEEHGDGPADADEQPATAKATSKTRGRRASSASEGPDAAGQEKEPVAPKPAAKGRGRRAANSKSTEEADAADVDEEPAAAKPTRTARAKRAAKASSGDDSSPADVDEEPAAAKQTRTARGKRAHIASSGDEVAPSRRRSAPLSREFVSSSEDDAAAE